MTWKMVVDVHGGTLDVDSAPGAGTTVTITVPLNSPARAADGARLRP